MSIIVWHGRTTPSRYFHRRYCGSSAANDQLGPGFYFTSDQEDAARYGAYRLQAELNVQRWVPTNKLLPEKVIEHLLACCPKRRTRLAIENWSYDLTEMLNSLIHAETAHEQLLNFWWDLYSRQETRQYLRAVSVYYQGYRTVIGDTGITHYVIFDPDAIEVMGAEILPRGT